MEVPLDYFVADLLKHPDGLSLSLEQESALRNILDDFLVCEEFLHKLAEGSPDKTRALLTDLFPEIVPDMERAICRVEETHEAAIMSAISDEELETRLTLLSLLPSEAPETERTARVLVRVVAARNPARVLEMSKMPWSGDREFWNRLRHELSWYFAGKAA